MLSHTSFTADETALGRQQIPPDGIRVNNNLA